MNFNRPIFLVIQYLVLLAIRNPRTETGRTASWPMIEKSLLGPKQGQDIFKISDRTRTIQIFQNSNSERSVPGLGDTLVPVYFNENLKKSPNSFLHQNRPFWTTFELNHKRSPKFHLFKTFEFIITMRFFRCHPP